MSSEELSAAELTQVATDDPCREAFRHELRSLRLKRRARSMGWRRLGLLKRARVEELIADALYAMI